MELEEVAIPDVLEASSGIGSMRKPNEIVQLKLRFSERLRVRLEKAAAKNKRSLNSEIIRRLERSCFEDELLLIYLKNRMTDLDAWEEMP